MNQTLNRLLLHPKTKQQLEYFITKPANSLLILGDIGSGKRTLALSLAATLLDISDRKRLLEYPYFMHVQKADNKQDITIEQVREINRFMRLKTPGINAVRRVVFIEDAQDLSLEAQNALLKMLEETNDDAVFLLSAPHQLNLLPTIVSRCQQIYVNSPTYNDVLTFFDSRFDSQKLESAWNLSQGNVGLLEAILVDDGSHSLKIAVEQAKDFIKKTKYERLLFMNSLDKNRAETILFLEALAKVLAAIHHALLAKDKANQANKILSDRQTVRRALEGLDQNGNIKMITLELLLKLNV